MALSRVLTLICATSLVVASGAASGQESAPRDRGDEGEGLTFDLLRDTEQQYQAEEEEETQQRYVPAIEAGKLETSFTLGFLDLNTTLLEHKQITYRYTDEKRYWGDVKLQGESAFNPILRLSYNLSTYFALEGLLGLSVSKYKAEIVNTVAASNETGSDDIFFNEPVGEFDAENRSLITLSSGLAAVLYPFDFGDGEGRFHPYLTGGLSRMWYSMNSNYTDKSTATWNTMVGGGIRLIADDLISLRFEVAMNLASVEFEPAQYFEVRDEGTRPIPLTTYPSEERVTAYEAQDLSSLAWSLGFIASF